MKVEGTLPSTGIEPTPFRNFVRHMTRAYFRHLLRAVPARNAVFEFLLTFLHSKNFKFALCLGLFRLWITLNLLKQAIFMKTACISCLSKRCPDERVFQYWFYVRFIYKFALKVYKVH